MKKPTSLIRLVVAMLLLVAAFQIQTAQSAECTEGATKNVITGPYCSCEFGTKTPKDRYQCIGGVWVYQYSFCSGPFCQGL